MIRIQSYPIDKFEEANKFMESRPPRSVENQSGLVFHNGNIVIIYEDGKPNKYEGTNKLKILLEGEREKLLITEHHYAESELALKELSPEGYDGKWPDSQLKAEIKKITPELRDRERDVIFNQIKSAEDSVRMDKHEVRRLKRSIIAYENLLIEHAKTL